MQLLSIPQQNLCGKPEQEWKWAGTLTLPQRPARQACRVGLSTADKHSQEYCKTGDCRREKDSRLDPGPRPRLRWTPASCGLCVRRTAP